MEISMVAAKQVEQNIVIKPPKFSTVEILIEGIAPLVVERFSKKMELMEKMALMEQTASMAKTAPTALTE